MLKILTMDINRKTNSLQTTIVLFFLLFTSLENGVLGQCVKNPVNKAVWEGTKDVVMSCAPNPTQVAWVCHSTSDELDQGVINNNLSVIVADAKEAFVLDPTGLRIREATIYEVNYHFATAGIYVGEYRDGTRLVGAKLAVVRNGPVCTFNVSSPSNGVAVKMNCSTTYADHSVHPIRPYITVTFGAKVIWAGVLETTRINSYFWVGQMSVDFVYDECVSINVVLTFDRPTDLQYKFIAKNAPEFSNSVTFPATSEVCLSNPRNIAVREGAANIIIELARNPNTLQWSVTPFSEELETFKISDFEKGVFSNVAQLYAVNRTGLVIRRATASAGQDPFSTAGIYVVTARNRQQNGAKLIVVRSGPTCSSNVDNSSPPQNGDPVKLTCTIEYADHSVHPCSPTIVFKRNGVIIATTTPPRNRRSDNMLYGTASTDVSHDSSAVDECVVRFNPPQSDNTYRYLASNAPDYSDSCSY